jgi:hypothetical protein
MSIGDSFCNICGAAISATSSIPVIANSAKNRKKIFIGVISIVVVIALVVVFAKPSVKKVSTVNITNTMYGTTCSAISYNYSDFNSDLPVRLFGSDGTLIDTVSYGSGTDSTDYASSGNLVDTCYFTATFHDVPETFKTYVVADNSNDSANGITCTLSEIQNDNCGVTRGYDSN